MPNPLTVLARLTRLLQRLSPGKPVRGIWTIADNAVKIFPNYQGVVALPDSINLYVNTGVQHERYIMFRGINQPALEHVLRQRTKPRAHCLDIGVLHGLFTLKFARWAGPEGKVISVEANPTFVARLNESIALNGFDNIEQIHAAVHNQPGDIEFLIAHQPGQSSIHAHMVKDMLQEKITVPAIVIDDLIAEKGWDRLDVIKVDIEGNDCTALLGARQAIARFKPFIAFEWHESDPDIIAAVQDFLTNLGYRFEYLMMSGERGPFHWKRNGDRLFDVLCFPPGD